MGSIPVSPVFLFLIFMKLIRKKNNSLKFSYLLKRYGFLFFFVTLSNRNIVFIKDIIRSLQLTCNFVYHDFFLISDSKFDFFLYFPYLAFTRNSILNFFLFGFKFGVNLLHLTFLKKIQLLVFQLLNLFKVKKKKFNLKNPFFYKFCFLTVFLNKINFFKYFFFVLKCFFFKKIL